MIDPIGERSLSMHIRKKYSYPYLVISLPLRRRIKDPSWSRWSSCMHPIGPRPLLDLKSYYLAQYFFKSISSLLVLVMFSSLIILQSAQMVYNEVSFKNLTMALR